MSPPRRPNSKSAGKRRSSPRDSLLSSLIESCRLGEGPSVRLPGWNYALQAVNGDET